MILLQYHFFFPSDLIYVTENIFITTEEKEKMLKLFKLHWYSKSNLIVMFLTLREVVSILKIQL